MSEYTITLMYAIHVRLIMKDNETDMKNSTCSSSVC